MIERPKCKRMEVQYAHSALVAECGGGGGGKLLTERGKVIRFVECWKCKGAGVTDKYPVKVKK